MSSTPGEFWSRYEALVSHLFPPLGLEHGVSEEELNTAEARMGLRLPPLLRQFYRKAGRQDDINRAHNRLLRPGELSELDGALVFYEENQAVVLWAIERDALSQDDPPVVSASNGEKLVWEPEQEHLSGFLLDMMLWQAVNSETLYGGVGQADAEAIARVGSKWEQIELGLGAGSKAFLREGQLLYVVSRDPADSLPDVYGAGRTLKDLSALTQTFGVTWDYSALDEEETQQEAEDEDE